MRQKPFEAEFDGVVLRGTLYLPAGRRGLLPAAILVHGFGSNRMESGIFVRLGRALADRGIIAVAFDRTGHGESDGSFTDLSFDRDVADVLHVHDAVGALDTVDPGNLHLVGMSMGAVVATVAAAARPDRCRSLTLISTAASFADEIRGGTLQGHPVDVLTADGYFDFLGARLGTDFLQAAPGIDVYGRARGFAGPVRMLHGTADFIPVAYAERYRQVYGDKLDITIVPEADHGWTSVRLRDLIVSETVTFIGALANRSGR